jgi:uncharacterized RDD family membrane protein YckC
VGTPAPAGRRVASFSIDMAVMAAVAVTTGLLAHSLLLGVVAAVQVLGILWIMQARAGVSLGAWLMELRVSREDAPFSPGAVPALVRGAVTAAGGLILGGCGVPHRRRGLIGVAGKVVAVVRPRSAGRSDRHREEAPRSPAAPHGHGRPDLGAAAGGRRRIEPVVDADPAVAGAPDADITLAETWPSGGGHRAGEHGAAGARVGDGRGRRRRWSEHAEPCGAEASARALRPPRRRRRGGAPR